MESPRQIPVLSYWKCCCATTLFLIHFNIYEPLRTGQFKIWGLCLSLTVSSYKQKTNTDCAISALPRGWAIFWAPNSPTRSFHYYHFHLRPLQQKWSRSVLIIQLKNNDDVKVSGMSTSICIC